MHVENSVCCLVHSKCPMEALIITGMQKCHNISYAPHVLLQFFISRRGRRRCGERKRKHKHSDLERNLCFEADKYNLSWDCQALELSLHIGKKKRQARLIWGLHYLLHLAWLGTASSLYKPITPSKASAEWPLMGSDMAGMGLTQHRDKRPSIGAKILPALQPRCSTTKERTELNRSQGLWARGDTGLPGALGEPCLPAGRAAGQGSRGRAEGVG